MTVKPILKMSFDPRTIEHLGIKMYSNIPCAVAELIANSYDADAKNVEVKLYDSSGEKRIEVVDDGHGMTFDEINSDFLKIGRNRRLSGAVKSLSGTRKATGKKGLGKLALFGLGELIEITTIKENTGEKISFKLDWNELLGTADSDYKPNFEVTKCDKALKGTSIVLKGLKRKSNFDEVALSVSLSRLFNFFGKDFVVSVSVNDGKKILVSEKLKYESIKAQFQWNFPSFFSAVGAKYPEQQNIRGEILSTEKPLSPELRGITLFANGRMVNEAEFFGVSESSHGFSYFTGWLNIDFVDELKEDVISTNRQSINWELPQTEGLREFLRKTLLALERDWRDKRKKERNDIIKTDTKVDIESWYRALPSEILNKIEPLVNAVIDDSELSVQQQAVIVGNMHALVPEYPYYHWRHLNSDIQSAAERHYQERDYYTAFREAAKRYSNKVRAKSSSSVPSDNSMMGSVFGATGKLKVTQKYKRPDGNEFNSDTVKSIEEGQKHLSMGMISSARNPLSHEEDIDLRVSGLFTEKDCLDALSLLSHLFRRLNDA